MNYLLKAIKNLRPNSSFSVEDTFESLVWLSDGEPPDKSEVEEEILKLQNEYKKLQYQRDRKQKYLPVEEQLDMLYHDIINNSLTTGEWVHHISSIKLNYPKK
jgi:hypothetical protein